MDKDYLEGKRNFVKRLRLAYRAISLSRSTKYIFSHFGRIIRVLIFLLRKFEMKARIEIRKEVEGETRKEGKNFERVTRNC